VEPEGVCLKTASNRRQGFIYCKQDFTQLHPGFYVPQASFMYRRQGFVYRQLVCDYCKQGFTYLHPAFTNRKQDIMYRRQGFSYCKQVSDYKVLHTSVYVLANVNSRSRSLFAVARPSVC